MTRHRHPPSRRRRKEARPQQLLDAALTLFVEKGFAATRAEEVAQRAGVSKGTLYLYYPSKEELLKAVIRAAPVVAHRRAARAVAEKHRGPMADAAARGAQPLVARGARQPDLGRLQADHHRGAQLPRDRRVLRRARSSQPGEHLIGAHRAARHRQRRVRAARRRRASCTRCCCRWSCCACTSTRWAPALPRTTTRSRSSSCRTHIDLVLRGLRAATGWPTRARRTALTAP